VLAASGGSGTVFEPLEMVILGEGKHRYELHARHQMPLLLRLAIYRYPSPDKVLLRRVLGCPDLLHITYTRENGKKEERLLPFADLSRRLLATIGIPVQGAWIATPFSRAVRKVVERQRSEQGALRRLVQMCIKPELLRCQLLRNAYS
jgi:hypothetical protein